MTDTRLGNPAVVGLAGFGTTTLLLQFHNFGLCGTGVVLWTALFFGGLAQLVAGLKEYGSGNNFGFAAFTTYGAFWMSLAGIWAGMHYGLFTPSTTDIGWFLVAFTVPTVVYTLGALRASWAHSFLFVTLLLGFLLLDGSFLGGGQVWLTMGAVVLTITALTALYIMASIVLVDFGYRLPLGTAWLAKKR